MIRKGNAVVWFLSLLYMAAAAGFGGWRGQALWSDWGIWCFLLPPFVFGAAKTFVEWRRNPYWVSIQVGLVMTLFGVAFIGGAGVALAWVVSEMTAKWSEPTMRATAGIGGVAILGGLQWAAARLVKLPEPLETNDTGHAEQPAEPKAAEVTMNVKPRLADDERSNG